MNAYTVLPLLFVFLLSACGTTPDFGTPIEKSPIVVTKFAQEKQDKWNTVVTDLKNLGIDIPQPSGPSDTKKVRIQGWAGISTRPSISSEESGTGFVSLPAQTQIQLLSSFTEPTTSATEKTATEKTTEEKAQPSAERINEFLLKLDWGITSRIFSESKGQKEQKVLLQPIQLVISNSIITLSPADRLEKVRAFLILDNEAKDTGIKIHDVLRLRSEAETTKYGTLTTTFTLAGSLGLAGVPIPQAGGTGSLNINPSYTRSLQREITRQMIRRTFRKVNEHCVEVILDGEHSVNISGNTFLTILLSIPLTTSCIVWEWNCEKSEWTQKKEWWPAPNLEKAEAVLVWIVEGRQVEEGATTVVEDDDKYYIVQLCGLNDSITVWKRDEKLYRLEYADRNEWLRKESTIMNFRTESDADRYRTYLLNTPSVLSKHFKNGEQLTETDVKDLVISRW